MVQRLLSHHCSVPPIGSESSALSNWTLAVGFFLLLLYLLVSPDVGGGLPFDLTIMMHLPRFIDFKRVHLFFCWGEMG